MTNKVAVDLNVLGFFMKDIIVSNLNSTVVITMERNMRQRIYAQVLEKPAKVKVTRMSRLLRYEI